MISPPRHRVLFVIGSMGGGGAERQVLEILKRLDRARFEPMLYLAHRQGELLTEVPGDIPIFAYWDGSPEPLLRRILGWLKLTRWLRYQHLARILREQRIDLIYDRTYLATLDAAGACLFRPTPRISCCVVDPKPELELYARISTGLSWTIARKAYHSASIVLANSEGLRQRVLDYFQLDPGHVRVFHNLLTEYRAARETGRDDQRTLVDFRHESSHPTDDASSSSERQKTFLVVTAGRLHPQKGHRYLLEAVDELVHRRGRSLKLMIFGKGESEASLKNFVRTHRLESSILIAGFVDEPRRWYSQAQLFVLPSLFEGMPNALIEAAACGLPILSTDCPSGPAEILDNGRCGRLVPIADATALADAMEDAMDHPAEWRTRAELARQRVEQMFEPDAGMARLEKLMDETIHPSP